LFFNLRRLTAQIQSTGDGDLQPYKVGKIARMLDVPEQDVVNMSHRLIAPNHSLRVAVRMGSQDELQDWLVDESASQERASGCGRSKRVLEKLQKRMVGHATVHHSCCTGTWSGDTFGSDHAAGHKGRVHRPPPGLSRALFLCRTRHGIDETCAATLASALINGQSKHDATAGAARACHLGPETVRRIATGSKADQINQRGAGAPQGLGAETVR
jgi:hypothetical protein